MQSNNNIPLVSIALATYNGEEFLQQQLQSLVTQSHNNLEIIISDDGSTDSTISIINSFIAKGHNIILQKSNGNNGINKNFENAFSICKGIFIAPCDQDDIWLPNKIELLVNEIGNNALIYHDSLFIDEKNNSLNKTVNHKMNCYTGNNPIPFLLFNCVSGHGCMFKKELLLKAMPFPKIKYYDWWLAFLATQNGGIKYHNEILVHYRQHNNNITDLLGLKKERKHQKEFTIFEQNVAWYKTCKDYATTENSTFNKWNELYIKRNEQILNPTLFWFSLKNASLLFKLKRKNKVSVFFESLKLLWGIKLKKLFK